MRKWTFFAAVFMLVVILAACEGNGNQDGDSSDYGSEQTTDEKSDQETQDNSDASAEDMMKLQE